MTTWGLLAAALIASGAAAEPGDGPLHTAVAAGAGVAFGRVGAHVELIAGHVALFGGAGYDTSVREAPSIAAGFRFFSGRGAGGMLSLNFAYLKKHLDIAPAFPIDEYIDLEDVYLGATLGWRWRSDSVFLEASAGPAWLRARSRGVYEHQFLPAGCTGVPISCDNRRVILDLGAAVGFVF